MADPLRQTWGPANIDQLLASVRETILSNSRANEDQIFQAIPLFFWLQRKARISKSGGAAIGGRAKYAKNATTQAYTRYESLDTTPQDTETLWQAPWTRYSASVAIAGDDEAKVSGPEALVSLALEKTEEARDSLREFLNLDLFAATSATKKIVPLPVMVDNSSTVQDINSTTSTWWQSQQTASGSMASQGLADMRNMYNSIINQGIEPGAPDFLLGTQTLLEAYEGLAEPQLRYTDQAMADQGFENFKFKGAVFTYDPNATAGVIYFLSSKHLKLCVHSGRDFAMTQFVKPANQDARVAQILWMGQLVTTQRRKLGKLTGMSA